jgi:hypothetical protein
MTAESLLDRCIDTLLSCAANEEEEALATACLLSLSRSELWQIVTANTAELLRERVASPGALVCTLN